MVSGSTGPEDFEETVSLNTGIIGCSLFHYLWLEADTICEYSIERTNRCGTSLRYYLFYIKILHPHFKNETVLVSFGGLIFTHFGNKLTFDSLNSY